ncbi:alpha/beta hydrolase [Pelagibacterium halotolerans]|uniref:Putative lipase/esterase n=1 Tax=Pelagibacterium halotolerans (strain DSM 22347 / JCM 15775 / CGMCC 1.7692 / B2) TaxID=1082931 RepID=G4R7C9_PELHB|nr:alpha/beta hydrolase [Pelagibacterium halotolerans]AEQ51265.1 putative lipase/esterase [Pelagibacterium halotolerans B2]QJR18878.1 alpha/beta hydrolase [Pelagibacterium halotolerans]SEA66921.1 Acetyl esterase/lipase [Pelagibacterium halotolerans]
MTINERRQAVMNKELEICLERVVSRSDGSRLWPELYFAQPMGFRALTLNLAVPNRPGPAPVLVYIHGGGWMFGHPNVQHPNLAAMNIFDALHAEGYAVARISYRLSGEGRFPMQLHDCKAAIRYLRKNAALFGIDERRIAVLGESAGGHLAMLLGLETPPEFEGTVGVEGYSSRVHAVIDWYGITNFRSLDAQRLANSPFVHDAADSASTHLLGGAISARPEAARDASPLTWVSKNAAPCLIQHGTGDIVVPPGQGDEYFAALGAAGVPAEIMRIEGADHCFVGADTRPIADKVISFLNGHLQAAGGMAGGA